MNHFRTRLAHAEALPQLAIMGLICGLATSVVAIAFRLAIELPLGFFLPLGDSENFEELSSRLRLALPLVGAIVVAWVYSLFGDSDHRLGVSHVIERYQLNQGQFSAKNMLLQFIGGSIALLSGHSGGREGPAVHLGAASSSLIGQWMRLPHNSLRILTGCGIAAAIAASFNTPLAGVIFAMEVVMMEYTVTGFIPIIISAITGSIICRLTFGSEPAFAIPPLGEFNFLELPWLLVCGMSIGLTAAALLSANRHLLRYRQLSHWLRFPLIGLMTAAVGFLVPEILGLGYDTLQDALLGKIALSWLLVIIGAKLGVFTLTFALGTPVGGIGPMFFLGACIGGAVGILGGLISPGQASATGFYATLGMAGMMSAALNAPLAALVAILELTNTPEVIMPSMLVIVCASLTARLVSHLPGLFLIGHDPRDFASPVRQMLNRTGVTSLMNTDIAHLSRYLPWGKAVKILTAKPQWIVVEDLGEPRYLMRPGELARYLEEQDTALWEETRVIDLREIPAHLQQLFALHAEATLQEAWMLMKKENISAVYISRPAAPLMSDVAGIITQSDLEAHYQV